MIEEFNYIYENKIWGDDGNNLYSGSSGGGSEIDFNIHDYVPFIQRFIEKNNITSVCDLGCGTGKLIESIFDIYDNIIYYGYDCYSKIICYNQFRLLHKPKYNFIYLDIINNIDEIINCELYIMKDILQHWKLNLVYYFLDTIISKKKCKYILICNCCKNQTSDRFENVDGALNAVFYPLKKYNPEILLEYNTKQVCLITI